MPEPLTLFALALGQAAVPLLRKAAEDHVKSFFGDRIKDLAKLGKKKPTVDAMERAWASCVEIVLDNVRVLGDYDLENLGDDEGFRAYGEALKRLLKDEAVGLELLKPLLEADEEAPAAAVLRDAWHRENGPEMPAGFSWDRVTRAYRQRLEKRRVLSDDLRGQLNAENLVKVRELLEARAGVLPRGDEARYAQRMREKYRVLDLSAMRPPTSDETGQILLRDAFMPQKVREDPPPVELPRDVMRRLIDEGIQPEDAGRADEFTAWQIERVRESYSQRIPEPVLEVVGAAPNHRLVLLGGPGSGKSTLARFLLLTLLDSSREVATEKVQGWTAALQGSLPLLVELREFIAVYDERRCDNFLGFLDYLGSTQKYHLQQNWLDGELRDRPTLVVFDGLDEIFDAKKRERVMHAIVGFAGEYPKARVVVTSRPVGYHDASLRAADFRHYEIQDLDEDQIETFVTSWFDRLFPDQEKEAEQRRDRILKATQAPAIRLLAGNPMLLTIMALIAQLRELPRERWRFYDHAADVLCHHWDVNRHLGDLRFADYVGLEDKKELLRRIAFIMQEGEGGLSGNVIREATLQGEIESYLMERYGAAGGEAKQLATRLIRQLRERNYVLCLRGPDLYGFVHRTFLEYFCALELVRKLREDPSYGIETLRDEIFATRWQDPSWREVLRLVCGMAGEANAAVLVKYLTRSAYPDWRHKIFSTPPANLILALQCCSEVRSPRVLATEFLEALQEIIRTMTYLREEEEHEYHELLRGELLAPHAEFRPSGAARRWLEQNWSHVSAQLQSYGLRDVFSRLVAVWLSESPWQFLQERALQDEDFYVRSAALEALARGWSQEAETRDLLRERALQDENFYVRSAALSALALGWSQEAETRDLLRERALQDENEYVRSAALSALARSVLDPRAAYLLSRRRLGRTVFLDPLTPITNHHLSKRARRIDLDETTARELLASCESVLGWNPLEGGRPS